MENNNLPWKLPPTRDDKLWKNITGTQNSNCRRIEHSSHISLLNSSWKTLRYATRRQINSADGNIVEAEAPIIGFMTMETVGPYGQVPTKKETNQNSQIYLGATLPHNENYNYKINQEYIKAS